MVYFICMSLLREVGTTSGMSRSPPSQLCVALGAVSPLVAEHMIFVVLLVNEPTRNMTC